MKTLSHMYRRAWHTGLKTTYYLRHAQASSIEKATLSSKKEFTESLLQSRRANTAEENCSLYRSSA